MSAIWSERFSAGAKQISSSAIRDLLKITEQPEIISFAGGLPAPECFPVEELTAAAERVLVEHPIVALQYGLTEGYTPLRGLIAELVGKRGIPAQSEDVLITSGSQQALDILGKLLIDADAPIVVEQPTYVGALQAWRPYRPRFLNVPLDHDGLDLAVLKDLLDGGERPRFLYVVSCFQNPTGITLSLERRRALLEIAEAYGLPIIEDDPYGELYYEGSRTPTLAGLDIELYGALRHVVYLSTFSKLLAPGLRIGWVVAPKDIAHKIVQAKQGLDLHSSTLTQTIAYEACRDGLLDRHIPTIRATYHVRRDAMLASLERHMHGFATWTQPHGGMFIWLTLPEGFSATDVLQASIAQKVAFVPGNSFFATGGGTNTMRLNFSHAAPDRIEEGITRLRATFAALR